MKHSFKTTHLNEPVSGIAVVNSFKGDGIEGEDLTYVIRPAGWGEDSALSVSVKRIWDVVTKPSEFLTLRCEAEASQIYLYGSKVAELKRFYRERKDKPLSSLKQYVCAHVKKLEGCDILGRAIHVPLVSAATLGAICEGTALKGKQGAFVHDLLEAMATFTPYNERPVVKGRIMPFQSDARVRPHLEITPMP